MILRVILIACILAVIAILSMEIRGWIAGTTIRTRFQKALRIASASLMIAIPVMVLVGDTWVWRYGPLAVMVYWITCFVLAVMLIIIALFDLREIGFVYGEERKRILQNLDRRCEEDGNVE